jgi:hypothetical protein
MSSLLYNLKNKNYSEFFEILAAATLLNLLGRGFLELLVYPIANYVVMYETYDDKRRTFDWRNLARLIVIIAITAVFYFGVKISLRLIGTH